MKDKELKDKIRGLIAGNSGRELSEREISASLKLRGKMKKRLSKCLREISMEMKAPAKKSGRHTGTQERFEGKIEIALSGNALLKNEFGEVMVTIPKRFTGTALHRDTVRVEFKGTTSRRRANTDTVEGKVVKIISRAKHEVVGIVQKKAEKLLAVPIDRRYRQPFNIIGGKDKVIPGERVVVKFEKWTNFRDGPNGTIIEKLGLKNDPSVDIVSVIRHFNLRTDFPDNVMREAEHIAETPIKAGKRLDLRKKHVVTIDPERAKDFDDALSLEKDKDGNRVLGVHIADVGHYVKKGSELDKEAFLRGNSAYFYDRVIPMLPEQLSNGICSLRPNVDRFTMSVFITFDRAGKMKSWKTARTIIRSNARLTYEQVMGTLDGKETIPARSLHNIKKDQIVNLLNDLNSLAQQLRSRRFSQYALDIDVPEMEPVVNEEGIMTGIRAVVSDISHQLVEECMIAANEAVARSLAEAGYPVISRFHKPPDEAKIFALSAELDNLNVPHANLRERSAMCSLLRETRTHPLRHHISVMVLRSMNRAIYSSKDRGHFGLAKRHYSHFTSPIRRYPDLITHRTLALLIDSRRKNNYAKSELEEIARHCSDTEKAAEDAENMASDFLKYRFLFEQSRTNPAREYDAVIVDVTVYGLFVELIETQVQGLIHNSSLPEKRHRFNRRKKSFTCGKKTMGIGDRIKVTVGRVDIDNRKIDMFLVLNKS